MAKRKAIWLLLLAAPLSIILLIIIPEGYGDIALFHTGSMPSSNRMECTSPSFRFGGTYFGSCPGNTLQYLHSKSHSGPRCSSVTPSKWGTAPSGRSFFPYKTSWRNSTGLPDVFN